MPLQPRKSLLAGVLTAGLVIAPAAALPASATTTEPTDPTTGVPAPAEPAPPAAEGTEKISILSFNDFHGALSDGYSGTQFADTVEDYRAQFEGTHGEGSTLLTTAGDLIGASASVSNVQQDEPTLEIMNALGLAVSAAGNHEFDKGLDDLQGRVAGIADFEFVAANFVDPETQEPVLSAYETFEVDGYDVAVIGAVPNNLYATTTGSGLQGNEVLYHVEAVNAVAEELEASGEADIIIASYHDGASGNGDLAAETASSEVFDRIVNETDDAVDVIFNGHTHQTYNYDISVTAEDGVKERPVVQAGQSGNLLAAVELEIETASGEVVGYESTLIERSEQDPAEAAAESEVTAAVYALEQAAVAEFEELQGQVIGEIDASITTDYQLRIAEAGSWRAGGTRRQETTLGNWAADALKDRVALSNPEVDLGVTNSGGLRAELLYDQYTAGGEFTDKPANLHGQVTLGEVLDFAPFGNTLVYFDVPGSSIKQVIEENWENGDKALHLGWSEELTYTYDDDRDQDDKVTGIWIEGEPLEMDETYTIATLSFLGDTSWVGTGNEAPDGYEGFAAGQENYVDLGIMDNQAFQEYIEAQTAAEGAIRPDFAKKSVEVTDAPEAVAAGDPIVLTLDNLELDSDGAGDATGVSVAFEGPSGVLTPLGTTPVAAEGESVTLDGINAPAFTGGEGTLVMTAAYDDRYSTTTEVRIPLTVTDVEDFTDNARDSSYYTPVRWLQLQGISTGYTNGLYGKYRDITRAESVTFLYRYLDGEPEAEVRFTDVAAGQANYGPISWAAAEEIAAGYSDGTFRPYRNVTRAEFVSFLYRASGEDFTAPADLRFGDVSPSSAHFEAIAWASASGIVNGYRDGDYRPHDPISRAEVAKVLNYYDNAFAG